MVDILVVVGIMYRGNVLGGTKSVFRCTLYHLKRFLVHGIVTRGQQMVTSPIIYPRGAWSSGHMCRSKGMAGRGHMSGRGPRSGKDERQRTFRRHMCPERRLLVVVSVRI